MSKFINPFSRDERAKYDESLKILRDRLSEIAYAEKKEKKKEKRKWHAISKQWESP